MNEITLQCADSPDAKTHNFLATLQPLDSDNDTDEDLPFEVIIDRYSRDPWSLVKSPNEKIWKTCWFASIDDKKRLPGFLQFLKQRKKAAFGVFESPQPDEKTGNPLKAVFLVPFEQPSHKDASGKDVIFVKYCLDERQTRPAPKPQMKAKTSAPIQNRPQARSTVSAPPINVGKGLLGRMLQGSHRTNQHLDSVPAKKKETQSQDTGIVTSGQIINKFRDKVEDMLNDFGSNAEQTETKIEINLAALTRELSSNEEKEKVTIKVLEFVVNEAVEDINPSWTPYKEKGEFLDEARIMIYKEGHVPADVQEDLNRGEVPDEVKQEQRAMREARNREEKKKLKMIEEQNMKKAASQKSTVSVLNTDKRDRRSIEEIQKDMMGGGTNKRARY